MKELNSFLQQFRSPDILIQHLLQKFQQLPEEIQFSARNLLIRSLIDNRLTHDQRIPVILLLIDKLNQESAVRSIESSLLLHVLERGSPFERKVVLQVIVDHKRQKYLKLRKEQLVQESQKNNDFTISRQQYRDLTLRLRQDFFLTFPKDLSAQVEQEQTPPQTQSELEDLPEIKVYSYELPRILPQYIAISQDQLHWTQASEMQIRWDNSFQNNESQRCARLRQLIDKLEVERLTLQQQSELTLRVGEDPIQLQGIDLHKHNLSQIIQKNSDLLKMLILKISFYFKDYSTLIWKKLIQMDFTPSRLDFIFKLFKRAIMPCVVCHAYITQCIYKAYSLSDKDQHRQAKVRALLTFLTKLWKISKLNLSQLKPQMEKLCQKFMIFDEAATLYNLLTQQFNRN